MRSDRDRPGGMEWPDLVDFIAALRAHEVRFVLVGGYAVAVHGVARSTADADFFYDRTAKNVQRLMAALREFGAPPKAIDEKALMKRGIVTQFGAPPHRIDLLNDIDGVSFAEARKGAVSATFGDQPLTVIGLKDLITNKRATARPRDLEDVRALTARRRKAR